MNSITRFLAEEVEPLLFSYYIPSAFPNREFVNYHGKWLSRFKLDGSPGNKRDEVVVSAPKGGRRLGAIGNTTGNPSISVVNLFMQDNNLSDIVEASKRLGAIVGKELPELSPEAAERARAHQQKQSRISELVAEMKKALRGPEGATAMAYLRQQRGYSDIYIDWADFGYISENAPYYKELYDILSYHDSDGGFHPLASAVGKTHVLAIPYESEGDIKGIEFRAIDPKIKDKYRSGYISADDTQAKHFFGLTSQRFVGTGKEATNITVVEGELDAKRGIFAGIPNIVAASQGRITISQLMDAKAKGVKSVTLMMDTEEVLPGETYAKRYEKQINNQKGVATAVKLIMSQGLHPYVIYLPQSQDGEKVDLDSFLMNLEGDELRARGREVQKMIKNADGGFVFLYEQAEREYFPEGKIEEIPRILHEFTAAAINLYTNKHCPLYDRRKIAERFEAKMGHSITAEDFEKYAEEQKIILFKQKQKDELKNLLTRSLQDVEKGTDPQNVIASRMQPDLERIVQIRQEQELARYTDIDNREERRRRRLGQDTGEVTSFFFRAPYSKEKEQLILPPGALTYICAPTSHGKSRLLQNLAMQVADNPGEGAVLFFTIEEDRDAVTDEFLNMFSSRQIEQKYGQDNGDFRKLSANNLRTILSYYTEQNPDKRDMYFEGKGTKYHTDLYNSFIEAENTFYEKYIDTGRLRVYYEEKRNSDDIIKAIKFIRQSIPIKAVFIDYLQKLKKHGDYKGNRKEELTAVTEDLMTLSVSMQIPFVLAVQMNRDTLSPMEMDLQNIADASEIECSGNIILLCWNASFRARFASKAFSKSANGEQKEETADFLRRTNISLGEHGKMFAFLAKNRKGMRGLESVFNFNENQGSITQDEEFLTRERPLANTIEEPEKNSRKRGEYNEPPENVKRNLEAAKTRRETAYQSDTPQLPFETPEADAPF